MIIENMKAEECLMLLAQSRLCRLACSHQDQPYIVPVYLVYHESSLYGFSTRGQKVEWMRGNPRVCVEVDEIADEVHWRSIVIFGQYEELPDTPESEPARLRAYQYLQQHAGWWETACALHPHRGPGVSSQPIFFRIRIISLTGHRAIPDLGEAVSSSARIAGEKDYG